MDSAVGPLPRKGRKQGKSQREGSERGFTCLNDEGDSDSQKFQRAAVAQAFIVPGLGLFMASRCW